MRRMYEESQVEMFCRLERVGKERVTKQISEVRCTLLFYAWKEN